MTDKERFYKVKEILTEFCQYDCTTMDRWQYVKDNAEIMLGAMERVQELEEENLILKATRAGNEELIDVLYKQNKRYREALEFYANKTNYLTFIENGKSNIEHDQGEKARKALGESE